MKKRLKSVAYLGSYVSFSVLVRREVRENSFNPRTFSILLEKPKYKNASSFLYRFEHAKLIIVPLGNTVPCRNFRESSF